MALLAQEYQRLGMNLMDSIEHVAQWSSPTGWEKPTEQSGEMATTNERSIVSKNERSMAMLSQMIGGGNV